MAVVAEWLARLNPALDRRHLVVDFTMPALLSNEADAVRRLPYFCSGCPHNTSTRVPEGSRALAGIGCHFMASWMERDTSGLIQMGAEGVDWAAHSRFTTERHVFQNLGDGTYFHSGLLAIRQAIAAGANITYKLLYNDAVAMTGGQPVDGHISVPEIARQVEAEGAKRIAVVSDDIAKYRGHAAEFPRGTTFHDRAAMDAVQRDLRRREAAPAQEGRARRSAAARLHQRACLRRLRRLRRGEQLPVGDSGRDRLGSQARDRAVVLQQGLLVPQRFLPQFRHGRRGSAEEARRLGRQRGGRGARTRGRVRAGALAMDGAVRSARDGRRRHRRGDGGRVDLDGRAPGAQAGLGARLHGFRAEGRCGAVVRAPGAHA
jgi:hypothetical protein